MDGYMDSLLDGWVDGWMGGWMAGLLAGWLDAWMDRLCAHVILSDVCLQGLASFDQAAVYLIQLPKNMDSPCVAPFHLSFTTFSEALLNAPRVMSMPSTRQTSYDHMSTGTYPVSWLFKQNSKKHARNMQRCQLQIGLCPALPPPF